MTDPVNPAAPAPSAQPVQAPATQAPTTQPPAAQRLQDAKNPTVKPSNPRASVITNPAPAEDPETPGVEAKADDDGLPQSTRDEMEAGKKALERNRPPERKSE